MAQSPLLVAIQALVTAHDTADTIAIQTAHDALREQCGKASVEEILDVNNHMAPWDLPPADQVEIFRIAHKRGLDDPRVTQEYATMLHHYYGEDDEVAKQVKNLLEAVKERTTNTV